MSASTVARRHSLLHIPQAVEAEKMSVHNSPAQKPRIRHGSGSSKPPKGPAQLKKKFKRKLSFTNFYNNLESSIRRHERRRTVSSSSEADSARGSPRRGHSTESEPDPAKLNIPDKFKRSSSCSEPDPKALRVAILNHNHQRLVRNGYYTLSLNRKACSQPDVRRTGNLDRSQSLIKTRSVHQVCHHSDCQDKNNHRPLLLCSECDDEIHTPRQSAGHLRFIIQGRGHSKSASNTPHRPVRSDDDTAGDNYDEEDEEDEVDEVDGDDDTNSVSSGSEHRINKLKRKRAVKGRRCNTEDPGASEMPSDNYKRSQSLQDLAPKTSPNVRLCREISVPLNIAMTTDKTIPEAHKEDSSDSSHGQMDSSSSLNTLTEGDPLSPKSDVFEDQGDSGTEDDSSSSQKGPARRVQSFSDDVQSDSSIPGPSPMEMQGPRRLKNASLQRERRTQQLTSSRIRKSSVPAHFWHQKSSEDVNRKVSLGMEYFTLRFDILDEADIQVVAAVKGVTLRNAISSALESRSLNIDAVDVFLASSKTPLPKDVDCYPLGGNNLHVRCKDGENPFTHSKLAGTLSGRSQSLAGSSRSVDKKISSGMYMKRDQSNRASASGSSTNIMHRRSVAATRTKSVPVIRQGETHPLVYTQLPSVTITEDPSESQRSRKPLGSLDDSGSLNDVSPGGSLRSMDSTLRSKGSSKGSSKLSNLFSPFNKGTEKHEQLSELLNSYSQNGWPVMPDLLNIGAQQYEEEIFTLDGHWKDFVEDHEDLSKSQKDHQEAIWELLQTELDYIRKVKVIIDLFMSCLCNLQNESIFNEIKTEMVFSNIRDVYQANCELWANYMLPAVEHHRKTKTPISASQLKDGFLKFEQIMQPYTKYCLEYDTCKEYIRKSREKNELFDKFLSWAEGHERCMRFRLEDLIVCPWQRLTKYHILLKAIKKPLENSNDNEDLKTDISTMIDVVEQFGVQVNRVMRQRLEHERLSNIIDRIEAYDAIEAPNEECMKLISDFTRVESLLTCQLPGCGPQEYRNLIREGSLKLKEPYSRMDVHCFLFTDMLLITKPNKKGDKVKVIKPPMRLDKIMVHSLRDGGSFLLLYLNEYHVASAVYTLHGDSSRIWLDAIKKAQMDYEKKRIAFMDRTENSVLDFSMPESAEGDFPYYNSRLHQVRERSPDTLSRQDSTGSTDIFLPSLTLPRSASYAEEGLEYPSSDSCNRPRSATFGNDGGRAKSPRPGRHPFHHHAHSMSECYIHDKDLAQSPPGSPVSSSRRDMQCQTHISYPSLTSLNPLPGENDLDSECSSDKVFFLHQRPDLIYDENLRSKLNQRRVGRGEKRYYTADAIQDLQKDKDASIHKRLSWNFGTTVDIHIDEKSAVLKGKAFSSDSLRSMPSSSGVSSTGSLHLSPESEICEETEPDTQLSRAHHLNHYSLSHSEHHFRHPSETLPESNESAENESDDEEEPDQDEEEKALDSTNKTLSKSMPDIYHKLNTAKTEVQDGIGSVELPSSTAAPKHRKKMSQSQLLRMKKQLLLTNSTVEASEV